MDTLKCTVKDKAKAIAVANDVLSRIDRRRIRRYSYGTGTLNLTPAECNRDVEVQVIADKIEKECETCLLGTCLISKARLFDNLTLGDLAYGDNSAIPEGATNDSDVHITFDRSAVDDHLGPIFGQREMDKLESFFEGRVMQSDGLYWSVDCEEVDVLRGCATEGATYDDPRDALVAALKNFLAHDCCIVVDPVSEDDYRGTYEDDCYDYEEGGEDDYNDEDDDEDDDEDC